AATTPEAGTAGAAAAVEAETPPAPELVTDAAALAALVAALTAAGRFGLEAPEIAKELHDAKSVEVLLRRRDVKLAGLAADAMLAAYLLDASRTRYDI